VAGSARREVSSCKKAERECINDELLRVFVISFVYTVDICPAEVKKVSDSLSVSPSGVLVISSSSTIDWKTSLILSVSFAEPLKS
jgi:hypothetical protein